MKIESELKSQVILRLNENSPKIEKCLGLLLEKEVWQKPNANSNSIGNLIIHLCGNITQYIISSLGENEDLRNRDYEFTVQGGFTKTDLLQKLNAVVNKARRTIENLDQNKLLNVHDVQGFKLTGIGILIHVVEHYSYHTGQISFYTKLLKDKDLGYYEGHNLNAKNKIS